jgi:sulfur-oxidizing protein SoxX
MLRRTCLVLVIAALVVACGGGDGKEETVPTEEVLSAGGAAGDSARGEELFNQTVIGSLPGCVTCHSLTPDKVLVGPSLAGIADRAGSRVPGESAEEYVRQSIVNTNAFIVDGFPESVMPAGFTGELSDQELSDLVAFLLTRK